MMPSADERRRDEQAARAARFVPHLEEQAPPPPTAATLRAAEQLAALRYASDRATRIRRGACPVRAERLCPRVSGPDVACAVG